MDGLAGRPSHAAARIAHMGSPPLVVRGNEDQLIQPALAQSLFDRAAEPRRLVMVPGG